MTARKRYEVVHMDNIQPRGCPCGITKRAFVDDPDRVASLHVVDIKLDSKLHYHKKLTEIYYVLEGQGRMELDGELIPIEQGSAILIKPGCRHRALGEIRIVNVSVPAFDPQDEWFDE